MNPNTLNISFRLDILQRIADALGWNVVYAEYALRNAKCKGKPYYDGEYEHNCFERLEEANAIFEAFKDLYYDAVDKQYPYGSPFDFGLSQEVHHELHNDALRNVRR